MNNTNQTPSTVVSRPTQLSSEPNAMFLMDAGQRVNERQPRGRAYIEMLPSEDTLSWIESAAATRKTRVLASMPGVLGIALVATTVLSMVVV